MDKQKVNWGRVLFYLVLGVYVGVWAFLNLTYIFNVSVAYRVAGFWHVLHLHKVWDVAGVSVEFTTALVGILATFILLLARSKVKKTSVERTILLLVGLIAFFFGAGNILTGSVDIMGEATYTSSGLTFGNIAPSVAYLCASIAGIAAIAVLIRNSYAILSRVQLLTIIGISLALLVFAGVFFILTITGTHLQGVVRGIVIFFSVVCLLCFVGTSFAIMAFGRGRGSSYWRSMSLGIMILAISGLAVFYIYTVEPRWVGLPLIGFTVGMALLAKAGLERLTKLKNQKSDH
ncbi:MAG: hypothetical protein JW724_01275 [Candidatus Altiarchaeota archaeon]|nr:hypothetical protein [Candidatus Altiarchaeota archaeon]